MAIELLNTGSGKNPLLAEECIKYLQERIKQEELSSRLYLAMSMWLNNNGYEGAASLWLKYSKEELTHADWARDYLLAMAVTPATPDLKAPIQSFTGLPQIIQMSYDHEIVVTKQCKELSNDALKKGDHMLYEFASKYMKEQIEEHEKMQKWVDRINAFGTDRIALRFLDEEMGK